MGEEKDFRAVPKRKLTEAEKQIIMLKIEKVKLQREKYGLILNKAVLLFFAFIGVAVIGLVNDIITRSQLNLLVIGGVLALIVGTLPYSLSSRKEEKDIEDMLDELTN